MTGIGGLIFGPSPPVGTKWDRLCRKINRAFRRWTRRPRTFRRFVVLCFRRTGSNWFCGMLFNHPQILMHNELFNENGVHTYYKKDILAHNWDYEGRDVNPEGFINFFYSPSKFSKFRTSPDKCKAVGYKSFPNHYLHKAKPLIRVYDAFQAKVFRNADVLKIILFREDVLRTYLSSRRAFETGQYMTRKYDDYKVRVDLVDLQRFVDRYLSCYREYRHKTQGQAKIFITYEDLVKDPLNTMKRIWRFLGVDLDETPNTLKECIPQSTAHIPLRSSIENYDEVEFACRHDPILSKFLDLSGAKIQMNGAVESPVTSESTSAAWALLIPVRASADDTTTICRTRVSKMYNSILRTTSMPNEKPPLLVFGVDDDDSIYRDGVLLQDVCRDCKVVVEVLSGLQGRICRIWKQLAAIAYDVHGVDFTLLLGDDVVIDSVGWQTTIEDKFLSIATQHRLPFGAACVAFNDKSFPGFPTFPVVHKWHYETFNRELLPSQFDNQGGDPYLFELYKRFGAAQLAMECTLENTIGGKDVARYTKQRLRFEDDILTASLRHLQRHLPGKKIVPTLDVVVPCYRCEIETIKRIIDLRVSWTAQVSFWVVLDNPEHPDSNAIRSLQKVAQNYEVRVLEQVDGKGRARNYGASAARNFGLAHSKADYCVLIDDDVTPLPHLLDAYLGAILRSPDTSVFVGSTNLPPPHNLLTHAIVASDIPGAYTISERTHEPPWGVTANLCVKARTSRLRFDLDFPKSGGGEDLDYCARARMHGPIKAVPGALAYHPWWSNGDFKAINHILGWAEGEVLCVGKPHMRAHVFWTFPNGIETLLLGWFYFCLVCLFPESMGFSLCRLMLSSFAIVLGEITWHGSRIGSHRMKNLAGDSFIAAVTVRCCAALLILSQELMRFLRALDESPLWAFWRVDWHFGQMPHLVRARKRDNCLRCIIYAALMAYMNRNS